MPIPKNEFEKLLKGARTRRAIRSRPTKRAIEIPQDFLEFAKYIQYPHIDTGKPVSDLTPIQVRLHHEMAGFKWDHETGERQGGSDDVAKGRRQKITSFSWAKILHALLVFGQHYGIALRAMTTLQVDRPDIMKPAKRQIRYAIERLPKEWTHGWDRLSTIEEIVLPGGGNLQLVSAGSGEDIVNRLGRSGQIDILHMSEPASYRYPEEVSSAAGEAVPATGWIMCEGTFPDSLEHWHAAEWFRTLEGKGVFTKAHFFPWYDDPHRRLIEGSQDYERVMSPEFEARMTERHRDDLNAEATLALTDPQRAFRRSKYLLGSARSRRKAKRENPEYPEMAFESPENTYFDPAALEALESMVAGVVPLDVAYPVTRAMVAATYQLPGDEPIAVGVDCCRWKAEFGRDYHAAQFIGARTWAQLGELHGGGLDSEYADSIVWMLRKLGAVSTARDERDGLLKVSRRLKPYQVAVERQYGEGVIQELQRRRVALWSPEGSKRPGLSTSERLRPLYFDAIAAAVEGPDEDEDGNDRDKRPVADIRSKFLVTELANIVWKKVGQVLRPDHDEKHHDDRVMAYGFALHIAPTIRGVVSSLRRRKQSQTRRPMRAVPMTRTGGPT